MKHHIDIIRKSSLRLTHLIDALLKYSRLEQQDLPRTRFNVLEMISSLVIDRQVLTPLDMERRYGITGGNIFHGEMSLDQMFVMRPVAGWARYRTPVRGLYLCGSGAHPGGGVMGAPGHNCAREMLKDGPRGH